MFTVGVDPNWQQDKLNRLMQALDLAKARREKKRQEEEAKATKKFGLIMSAAESNPSALTSSTVRDFVKRNATLIPGLEEWYQLESAALTDPTNPQAAYEKLLTGADRFAESLDQPAMAPGMAGFAMNAARPAFERAVTEKPALAFDAAAQGLRPSEVVRAQQYASKVGAEIPMTDPKGSENKKLSGPLYVLHNPTLFSEEEVRAARISLQLTDPEENPDKKVTGALYVLEHPDKFKPEVVKAAEYQLEISQPPWETRGPEDKLSGAFSVLNDPSKYSAEAVSYARALVRQAERSGSEGTGSGGRERGQLTEGQAVNEVDGYVEDLLEEFAGAGARPLTPSQRRKAAKLFREDGDIDTFIVNSMFPPNSGAIDKILNFHMSLPSTREVIKRRGENPTSRAAKVRADALKAISAMTKNGMNPAAARAAVFLDLLRGL